MFFLPRDEFPIQAQISLDDVKALSSLSRRRFRLSTEWPDVLREPRDESSDWGLTFPFRESYWNAFLALEIPANDPTISTGGVCATYLNGVVEGSDELARIRSLIAKVGDYVGIRDHLAMSFALDYEREDGDPNKPQTEIGRLRAQAKPYDRGPATANSLAATMSLTNVLCEFLATVECYWRVEAVCAVPPSDPTKPFHLAGSLASRVGEQRELPDVSSSLVTSGPRSSVRLTAASEKADVIDGSMRADPEGIADRVILLVDDLYQSGTTMNYAAMMLLGVGARAVFGLACEKTCRNDDNVSPRS